MNSRPFCGRQTSENVVFREGGDFGKMPILHSSAVLGRTPPTKYSQGFLDFSRGGQKTGKNQCFFGCLMCVFFYIVSSWSPVVLTYLLACKCVIHPCFLTLDVMFSFFPVVVFPCFYSSLFFLVFITFHLVVCLCCLLSWCDRNPDQITKYLKFWLSSSASVPASPHFHLAQIITLLGQEKNLSKLLFFVAFMLGLLAMCWNTYFYCAFTHHPNFAYKMGPKKKR